MAIQKEETTLYRVVKFEIKPTLEQIALLRKISDNLWLVWDEALAERQKRFDTHVAPLYEALKAARERQDTAETSRLRELLKSAYKEAQVTLFDQINALTARRACDTGFASVPRNWQEETLDTLDGAFKSFVALRKNGDPQARPPRLRSEWYFCEIPGRSSFSIRNGTMIELAPNIFGKGALSWPIPQEYQGIMLARAAKVKKFTLYRDERDMREKGRWWISLAYEIPKPVVKPFVPAEAVYVALGASSIGIVSPKGEATIPLWRSDKSWMPEIKTLETRIDHPSSGTNVHALTKGSRAWRRRQKARRTMFALIGTQQKQNRREIVADLLGIRDARIAKATQDQRDNKEGLARFLQVEDALQENLSDEVFGYGVHFVVSDLVVRSKPGKLADSSKKERGGALGLNWSAQNTGSIAYLVQWLEEKAKEYGGTVRKHRLPAERVPGGIGHENKIPMARALRDDFLRSFKQDAA